MLPFMTLMVIYFDSSDKMLWISLIVAYVIVNTCYFFMIWGKDLKGSKFETSLVINSANSDVIESKPDVSIKDEKGNRSEDYHIEIEEGISNEQNDKLTTERTDKEEDDGLILPLEFGFLDIEQDNEDLENAVC